jgi:hypothetical protein
MKKDKKFIITAVLCGLLFLVSIVGVVIGLTSANHTGLLYVCYLTDRAIPISYLQDVDPGGLNIGLCEPKELKWCKNRLKTGVARVGAPPTDDDYTVARQAFLNINAQMNLPIFAVGDYEKYEVLVEFGHPSIGSKAPANVTFYRTGNDQCVSKAIIKVKNVVHVRDIFRVLLHEGGHALGLAHDDYPGSVMYASPDNDVWITPTLDRFEDHDRDVIRFAFSE